MTPEEGNPMAVAIPFQGLVAQPAVRMRDAARFDGVAHKRHQTHRGSVGNTPHPDPADTPTLFLRRDNDQGPSSRSVDPACSLPDHRDTFRPPQPLRPSDPGVSFFVTSMIIEPMPYRTMGPT